MVDKFREECGVFGIYGHAEASNLTYLGLYALQHRGQESAGIASADGTQIRVSKAMGYVNEAFDVDTLGRLPGSIAVGHVRYSTAGESRLANAQPIVVDSVHGQLAVAPHQRAHQNSGRGQSSDQAGKQGVACPPVRHSPSVPSDVLVDRPVKAR